MNRLQAKEAYSKYFEIIDSYFGSIKHYLGDYEDSHIDLGINIANYPLISDLILEAIEDIDEEIGEFWKEHAKGIFKFITNEDALKCIYSGDISPVSLESFVKKSALYVDTIIIPDPIFNLTIFFQQIPLERKYYLKTLIRHVFNVWKLKELVLADTSNFILAILPINIHTIKKKNRKRIIRTADTKFINYINRITKEKIKDADEGVAFLESITNVNDLYKNLKNIHLLPKEFQTAASLEEFFRDFNTAEKFSMPREETFGWNFNLYLKSQFLRVQEHKYFCEKIQAEPIYDYELPWYFYNYEVGGGGIDSSISNALQRERFQWIGKVPIKAIKVFREENKLDYMRNIFRTGITDLKAKNDPDLSQVSTQLEKNLKEAFIQQKSEIKSLEEQVSKIVKKELPITIGGTVIGFIPYLGNAVSLLTAGRDITKLIQERVEVKQELSEKQESIINLLVRSYDG